MLEWALLKGRWPGKERNGREPRVGDVAWFAPDDSFACADLPDGMRYFALAKRLCEGVKAPPHVQSTLRDVFAGETLPCGISYEQACELSWREVPFPTFDGSKAAMYFLELGLWPENTPLPDCRQENIDPDSAAAIDTALALASRRTERQYVWWLRPRPVPFCGRSLALSVYLGAIALKESPDAPADVLATGDLDENGGIVAVTGVREKAALLQSPYDFSAFLVPANGEVPEDNGKIFPVATREDAEILASCKAHNHHLWRQILAMRGKPSVLWNELLKNPNYTKEEMRLVLQEAERHSLFAGVLEDEQLQVLADALDRHRSCLKFMAEKLSPGWGSTQPRCKGLFWLAYRLWKYDSRWGCIASPWKDIAEAAAPEVLYGKLRIDLTIAIGVTGDAHNAYRFTEDIGTDLQGKLETLCAQHNDADADPQLMELLAKGFGALTHHYAYCGKTEEAFKALKSSQKWFPMHTDAKKEGENTRRRLRDAAFIAWDAGSNDEAAKYVREYCNTLPRDAQPDKYALQLQARAAFESAVLPDDLRARLPELLGQTSEHSHPDQLFFWHMGRALPEDDKYRIPCLEAARDICLRGEDFTTLTPMALLPLSRLPFDEETRQKTAHVLELMRSAPKEKLNREHFKAVLDAPDEAAALKTVREELKLKKLFPFDYR